MSLFPTFKDIADLDPYEQHPDYHAAYSIQLCELINDGFLNWEEESWDWSEYAYNSDTYKRLCEAFNLRFKYQEISIVPPGKWKDMLLYKIKFELCPKYNLWYKLLENGVDLTMASGSEYGKERNIESEFPETLLSDNADYVSRGHDREYETVKQLTYLDAIERFKDYHGADQAFLDELQVMFSSMYTVSINGL